MVLPGEISGESPKARIHFKVSKKLASQAGLFSPNLSNKKLSAHIPIHSEEHHVDAPIGPDVSERRENEMAIGPQGSSVSR